MLWERPGVVPTATLTLSMVVICRVSGWSVGRICGWLTWLLLLLRLGPGPGCVCVSPAFRTLPCQDLPLSGMSHPCSWALVTFTSSSCPAPPAPPPPRPSTLI